MNLSTSPVGIFSEEQTAVEYLEVSSVVIILDSLGLNLYQLRQSHSHSGQCFGEKMNISGNVYLFPKALTTMTMSLS